MNEDQPQPARAKRQNTGFTLIELLIVIAILGILSVVVVLSVNGITNRGQGSSCSADLKTQQIAAESYRAQNATYPSGATQAEAQAKLNAFLNGPSTLYTYNSTDGVVYTLTPIGTACTGGTYTSPTAPPTTVGP